MTLDFSNPITNIGGDSYKENKPLHFGDFVLGNPSAPSPGWKNVTVSGNNYITLPNAKANGLNYLKLYGGCEQRRLPEGYTELEYLESTGTQRINTGIMADDNTDMGIVASGMTNKSAQAMVAGSPAGGALFRIVKFSASEKLGATIGSTGFSTDSTGVTKFKADIINKTFYLDDVLIGSSTDTVDPTYPIELFRGKYGTSSSNIYYSNFKCHSAYVKKNGELVLNLIPARRDSDNVLGMYDTVTGNFLTNAGAGTFTAGAEVTAPTPSNPIPIWCNNGELKARNTSGLPLGYTRLAYIESSRTQFIETNITPTYDTGINITYSYPTISSSTPAGICGTYASGSLRRDTLFVSTSSGYTNSAIDIFHRGNYLNTGVTPTAGQQYNAKINWLNDGKLKFEEQEENVGNRTIITEPIRLFTRYSNSAGTWSNTEARIHQAQFSEGSDIIHNFIPCKNPSNAIGMYDTITETFFANEGTGDFIAGANNDSIEFYADGTVETVEDSLNNTATAQKLLGVGDYKDIQSVLDGDIKRNVGVKVLDGSETWVQYPNSTTYYSDDAITDNKLSVMANMLLCTHYAPTVGSPMPENTIRFRMDNSLKVLSNRLYIADTINSTLADWKAWLAQQYTAGTPVVVLFPLSTEATETTTPQTLTLQQGTNTISITQASIDPLSLEANYKAGVEVTIEEIESANLDNNVTVTID